MSTKLNINAIENGSITADKLAGDVLAEFNEFPLKSGDGQNSVRINGTTAVAEGAFSLALGQNSIAYGTSTVVEGLDNYAGGAYSHAEGASNHIQLKGVYFCGVNTSAKEIYLTQNKEDRGMDGETYTSEIPGVSFNIGDKISIVTDVRYEDYATITDIDGNIITCDKLGISYSGSDPSSETVSDFFSIYSLNNPGAGIIDYAMNSHAEGSNNIIRSHDCHAEGGGNYVYGSASHVEGRDNVAGGGNSHAEGANTQALGNRSHAEGKSTIALGNNSHAEGGNTKAEGLSAHAEGNGSEANGISSHAEGQNGIADGQGSHAEGYLTKSISEGSHSEGRETLASGKWSHAEGYKNEATNEGSHAEGYENKSIGRGSHAEGQNTQANSRAAHAEGQNTIASGRASHAEGLYTIADGVGEHAEGKFNLSNTTTISSIGIGTSETDRKNAFEVLSDGKVFVFGVGDYTGENIDTANDLASVISSGSEYLPLSGGTLTGDLTAPAFYETSDERLKTFGEKLDVDIDALSKCRKSYFTFNDNPGKNQIGVSAQEIQKLYPEVVTETSNGYLSVDYAKLSVVALAAIDKLNERIKELEEKIK